MGRVGNNEQPAQETIDDSFPEGDPPAATKPRSQAPPSNNKPQTNRPHKEEEEEEDLYYVSSQVHHPHHDQTTAQFPPQNSEYELPNQHVPPKPNVHYYPHQTPQPQPQPQPQHGVPHMGHPVQPLNVYGQVPAQDKVWSSSLFDCMNDPQNALITACFPCVTFGQIAEILDAGNTTCATSGILYGCIAFCIAVPCIMSCTYRTKLRAKFGLLESPAQDWLVHCFCEWCALCQEYRELQHMGYDPTIGWVGNQAKMRQQNQQFGGMTPPAGQRMMM